MQTQPFPWEVRLGRLKPALQGPGARAQARAGAHGRGLRLHPQPALHPQYWDRFRHQAEPGSILVLLLSDPGKPLGLIPHRIPRQSPSPGLGGTTTWLLSWVPTVISIIFIFPDLPWQGDLPFHLLTPASVSPVAQPPHVITRPLSPSKHLLASSPGQSQPRQQQCIVGVASWEKVNIPQAKQRTWQGPHTSLCSGRWYPRAWTISGWGKGEVFFSQAWPVTLGLRGLQAQARIGGEKRALLPRLSSCKHP